MNETHLWTKMCLIKKKKIIKEIANNEKAAKVVQNTKYNKKKIICALANVYMV